MSTNERYNESKRKAEIGARWIAQHFKNHAELGTGLRTKHLLSMVKNLIGNIEVLHAHDRGEELVQTIKNLKADYDRAKVDFDATLRAWQADEVGYNELHAQSDRVARAYAALERVRYEYIKFRWEE